MEILIANSAVIARRRITDSAMTQRVRETRNGTVNEIIIAFRNAVASLNRSREWTISGESELQRILKRVILSRRRRACISAR